MQLRCFFLFVFSYDFLKCVHVVCFYVRVFCVFVTFPCVEFIVHFVVIVTALGQTQTLHFEVTSETFQQNFIFFAFVYFECLPFCS